MEYPTVPCAHCGAQISSRSRFCKLCGKPVEPAAPSTSVATLPVGNGTPVRAAARPTNRALVVGLAIAGVLLGLSCLAAVVFGAWFWRSNPTVFNRLPASSPVSVAPTIFMPSNPAASVTPSVRPQTSTSPAPIFGTLTSTSPAATVRPPTLVPAFSPTPVGVAFKFDEGVPQAERDTIQNAITLASRQFGDAGPLAVFAYANFDALTEEYLRYNKRSPTDPNFIFFRDYLKNDIWRAAAYENAIWVWVSDKWKPLTLEEKTMTLLHEYFHVMQFWLAKRRVSASGPVWLSEGAAMTQGLKASASIGLTNLDQERAERTLQTRGIVHSLRAFETMESIEAIDSNIPYSLGFRAVEFLVSNYGGDGALRNFWDAQGKGATWQTAFQSSFGIALNDFYSKFEEYRRADFPPYCGMVPAGNASPTPAPFAVTFAGQFPAGSLSFANSAWTQAPNIPYVFCATGFQMASLTAAQKSAALKGPPARVGWYSCGGNCLIVIIKPTTPAGAYTFAIELPDGRRAETVFQHKP